MKQNLVFLLLLLMSIILAACGKSSSAPSGGANADGSIDKFVYASTADVAGLSPILTNDSISANVQEHVYETLFNRNSETGEITPKLAESYENTDENTWMIKLRKDVKFHDGTPFNAEAVKYTFDKLRDPATAAPRASLLEPVDEINVINEYEIKIKTKYPYGPFLASLAHTNAAIVSPTADKKQDLMKEPVGTGPFKFVSYTPGDEVVLEANDEYRDGTPAIQQLVFKVVPEVSTAISMLQTGEVDFIDNLPSEQISRIDSLKNIDVTKKNGSSIYYLTVNHSIKENQDPELRKAIAAAIDRDAFVSKLNGLGVRSDSVLGPEIFGYEKDKDSAGQAYDPELAKSLVDKNGYSNRPIKLLTANRANFILMAEIVQAQLTEAGFKVQIETMEWAAFLDTARAGEYDITFLSWANLTQDGSEMLYPNLHSDNIKESNRTKYSNKKFDELVDASRETIDQDKRLEYLNQANGLLLEDNAVVVMYHGVVTAAMNNKYEGLILEPNGKWLLKDVKRK
ncbi:ABC transporter substrate-binding protein [Viridibacillus sp. FSL R5-0477]|uniref:Solute-binding family 5 protein n=1 Tax=Viridibacillus arenosi FSL R5-213 TaxID=1227360 RepID=W4F5F9_9BACL|nr:MULTISPECIES: ABC transporter substrate-binding protein [Viridibacillus]ETT87504.1 solute-binding family 5 protein [Viridibacillus arenosi FSL R5-213]OMC82566.1 glutathione ABC transporter substrate-binding protein [Viridibacillus sp. FSL H8-0123]OMC87693.1 glutathione ABC transporter substrate-binding protein [Viridibacillus sp. FSL H7-0596]OMC91236.1 glutathione ABC transporter substrate-binding protein [Viridibacillus arenosi]